VDNIIVLDGNFNLTKKSNLIISLAGFNKNLAVAYF